MEARVIQKTSIANQGNLRVSLTVSQGERRQLRDGNRRARDLRIEGDDLLRDREGGDIREHSRSARHSARKDVS